MANDKTSRANGKPPLTRHPLFPATVALWFGALFGIGSLAIRPSLIETIVTTLKIDAAIPSAAPPIGATGQILIALAMAGAGGLLGAWLARRLTRPRPVVTQRKRGANRLDPSSNAREQRSQSANRRSRLALSEEPVSHRQHYDAAPVPGAANILDVSQFDLEGFEERGADVPMSTAEPIAAAVPAPQWQPEPEPIARLQVAPEPMLDPEPVDPWQPAQEPVAPEALVPAVPWQPEPRIERIPDGAQVFQPIARETTAAFEQPVAHETNSRFALAAEPETQPPSQTEGTAFAPNEPVRARPFDGTAPAPLDPPPFAKELAEPIAQDRFETRSDEVDEECPAEIQAPLGRLNNENEDSFEPLPPRARPGSIFEQKAAPGLFTQPLRAAVDAVAWDTGAIEQPAKAARVQQPAQAQAMQAGPAAEAAPLPEQEPVEPKSEKPVDVPPSERIVAAPHDDMSPVELLERLALSMRRKRHKAAEPVEALPSQRAAPEPAAPEPTMSVAETVVEEPLASEAPFAPPVPTIPAALRPIGFDLDDDDHDLLAVVVPPRHFGPAHSAPAAQAVQEQAFNPPAEPVHEQEIDEGYSSLLSLSRPGAGPQRFVRIEEPQPASGEIEPVVVFPGKEPHASAGAGTNVGPFSRPESDRAASPDQTPVGQSRLGENPAAALLRDPAETERALRSALANIQRMSGAA